MYIPGALGRPHSYPHEIIPAKYQLPSDRGHIKGPPLSPCGHKTYCISLIVFQCRNVILRGHQVEGVGNFACSLKYRPYILDINSHTFALFGGKDAPGCTIFETSRHSGWHVKTNIFTSLKGNDKAIHNLLFILNFRCDTFLTHLS